MNAFSTRHGGIVIFIAAMIFGACNSKQGDEGNSKTIAHARELADKYLIVDGHVDFPYRLAHLNITSTDSLKSVMTHSSDGEFDFDRARAGGMDAPFMSIYIPTSYQNRADYGKSCADSLINSVESMWKLLPDKFAPAGKPQEVARNTEEGKISLPMGMENGAPIGMDIHNVQYFFDRGIRYITLAHTKFNQICGSSGDTVTNHQGLTLFGRGVVKEMNRVGIMVDISHVDDSTFYQVMSMTKVPCIASHSSCRYFVPDARRDMTDDMIRKMGDNGGVILVNFFSGFIDSTFRKKMDEFNLGLKKSGLTDTDTAARRMAAELKHNYPVSIEVVADHIDHIVRLAGVDHVGFGSDFDGVSGFLPKGLDDASHYPDLIAVLLGRGYKDDDIRKICGGNVLRVWGEVLKAAGK